MASLITSSAPSLTWRTQAAAIRRASQSNPAGLNLGPCCLRSTSRVSLRRVRFQGFVQPMSSKNLCVSATAAAAAAAAAAEPESPVNGGADVAGMLVSRVLVVAALVAGAVKRVGETLIATQLPNGRSAAEKELVAALKGRLVLAAGPLFFAAISQPGSVSTPLTVVASGMAKWLELYSGVLMVRVLLSWFPNIPWERQPLQAVRDMCDPYLNLFRNIIPPLFNALDLSPMLAFMVLGVLTSILNTTVQG